jgi:hypothetical protein
MIANGLRGRRLKNVEQATIKKRGEALRRRELRERGPALDARRTRNRREKFE